MARKPKDVVEGQQEENINIETVEEIPTCIQMLKEFRINYPLPTRRDTSVSLTLKAGQEITDKFMIQHVIKSSASFIIK